jgi:hypothetical protein
VFRIDNDTASTILPPIKPVGTPGFFTAGNKQSGQTATIVEADWANTVQEELAYIVEAGGQTFLDKADNTQVLNALRKMFIARTVLHADKTIYVDPVNGSDSNFGTSPGAGGDAFLTIQAAVNAAYNWYDWNGNICTIQLADGTYLYSVVAGYAVAFIGMPMGLRPGGFKLIGNVVSPQNVVITSNNGNCIAASATWVIIQGVTLSASGNINTPLQQAGNGLIANVAAYVEVSNCNFADCGLSQVACGNAAQVVFRGTAITMFGQTQQGLWAGYGGTIWGANVTFWVSSLRCTGAFAVADSCSVNTLIGATFQGSAVGVRYASVNNGVISTGGGGPNFLPGDTAGYANSGGQYN